MNRGHKMLVMRQSFWGVLFTSVMLLVLGGCDEPSFSEHSSFSESDQVGAEHPDLIEDTDTPDQEDTFSPDTADDTTSVFEPDTTPINPNGPCEAVTTLPEGAFLSEGNTADSIEACSTRIHAIAGAAGSSLSVNVANWSGEGILQITVSDLQGHFIANNGPQGARPVEFALTQSGEYLVRVESFDGVAGDYVLERTCLKSCNTPYTRYPIVFMHGFFGQEELLFGLLEYWSGIDDKLAITGYHTLNGSVDPFHSSEVRAEAWRELIDGWINTGKARRFNLMAHSQGGIDARHIAAHLNDDGVIASVTTISTPHRGGEALTLIINTISNDGVGGTIMRVMSKALQLLYGLDSEQDLLQAIQAAGSTTQAAAFNDVTPDNPDVYYSSWSSATCLPVDLVCQGNRGGEIGHLLLQPTLAFILLFDGPNDGLVSVDSAIWGDHQGTLNADHGDQIGLGFFSPGFDAIEFYHSEAERLRAMGF